VSAELLKIAESVAKAAGSHLMKRPATFTFTEKSSAVDFATQMDQQAEALIVKQILALRPDDGIIAEEGAAKESKSGITWVIDPLDGTVNYLYGLPGWNVSVCLLYTSDAAEDLTTV
jgi:myo-inositol-1(or 4)-monophosphatase